jgi:hypothetical protein
VLFETISQKLISGGNLQMSGGEVTETLAAALDNLRESDEELNRPGFHGGWLV